MLVRKSSPVPLESVGFDKRPRRLGFFIRPSTWNRPNDLMFCINYNILKKNYIIDSIGVSPI